MDWYGRLSLHTAFPNFKRVILFPLFRSYPHYPTLTRFSTGTQYITSSKMAQILPILSEHQLSCLSPGHRQLTNPSEWSKFDRLTTISWYPSWHGITLSRGGPLCWRLLCWLKVQMLLASTKHRIKSSNTRKSAGNMMTFQPILDYHLYFILQTPKRLGPLANYQISGRQSVIDEHAWHSMLRVSRAFFYMELFPASGKTW